MKKIIRGGTVVNARETLKADVLIDGETVVAVGQIGDVEGAEVIDATGCYLLPGLIDNHTHMSMPFGGTTTADDYIPGTQAAAAGGWTTATTGPSSSRCASKRCSASPSRPGWPGAASSCICCRRPSGPCRSPTTWPASGPTLTPRCAKKCAGGIRGIIGPKTPSKPSPPPGPNHGGLRFLKIVEFG